MFPTFTGIFKMINHKGIRKSSIFFTIHQDIVGDLYPSIQFYCSGCHIVGRAKRAPTLGCSIEILHDIYIGECGNTLYVGLTGIVRNLIQKSTGIGPPY